MYIVVSRTSVASIQLLSDDHISHSVGPKTPSSSPLFSTSLLPKSNSSKAGAEALEGCGGLLTDEIEVRGLLYPRMLAVVPQTPVVPDPE